MGFGDCTEEAPVIRIKDDCENLIRGSYYCYNYPRLENNGSRCSDMHGSAPGLETFILIKVGETREHRKIPLAPTGRKNIQANNHELN